MYKYNYKTRNELEVADKGLQGLRYDFSKRKTLLAYTENNDVSR